VSVNLHKITKNQGILPIDVFYLALNNNVQEMDDADGKFEARA